MHPSKGEDDAEHEVSWSDRPCAPFSAAKSGDSTAQLSACFAHHQQPPLLKPSTFHDSFPGYLIRSSPAAAESHGRRLNLDVSCLTATQSCTDIAGRLRTNAPSQSPNNIPLFPSSSASPTSNTSCKMIGATIPAVSPSDQATATAPTTPRGSKKRSRASRRAPTTVLTTDTSNFRQMVQEFTGIPTPPSSSSAFPTARLELFSTGAAASSIPSSPGIGGLLWPFAQKMSIPSPTQIPNLSFGPFSTSSSSSPATAAVAPTATGKPSTCSINTMMMTTTTTTAYGSAPTLRANPNSTGSHQVPADHASPTNESHGLLQSQLPAYQSLFQPTQQPPNPSQPNYSFPTLFGPRPPAPTVTSTPSAADGRDDLHTIATTLTLTALFGSESSRGGGGSISGRGGNDLPGWPGDGLESGGGGRYPSIEGCETAGPASELRGENRSEDVSSSSMKEGTVDSWICSSPD